MKKRTCLVLGMHAIIVGGITYGYTCMYDKLKKSKQSCLDY